ncbi:MAG: ABC transporter ATP-binding protein [Anaerolineae bacterium]
MSEHSFQEEEFDTSMNGGTLLRILGLTRPHWQMVTGFVFAIGAVAFLEAYLNFLNLQLIDDAIIGQDIDRLWEIVSIYAVIWVVFAVLVFTFIYLAGKLSQRVQYDLRKRLFQHLQGLSLSYYSKTPVGWIMSRATSDTERIAELVSWGLIDTTWAVMNITTALGFMFYINWQLTLIVVPLVPVLVYISIWFKERILVHYRDSRRYNSEITGDYNEMITGVRVIKGLNRERTSLREFGKLTRGMHDSSYRAAWYSALFLPSIQITASLVVGGIIYFGGGQIQNDVGMGLTIGGLNAFIGYITFMLWPIQDMARVYASMQHAIASAERTFSLLDTDAEIVDKPNAIDPGTIAGDILFDHVDFYYSANDPVLKDFSLHIKAGETIALVGHTGSGKSTLVNLLCRFYEPTNGVIRFGEHDYTDLTQNALQSRIGMVLQTPHLFSGTIRDNIRYGRLDASDAEVEEAAKLAGAHEFISQFDLGYDEQVGEGGVLLSTGQKQLISLARAVLSKPELFIMDEATSSVDTITEYLIQRGMEHLMHGRTSVIIAHRLSTIKNADRIIVLDHGKIIEMGSHTELIKQRGHYHTLYTKQFRKEAEGKYTGDGVSETISA